MVDVGSWAQVGKLGFKAPGIGGFGNPLPKDNKKKDEQKKADSSSQVQEKKDTTPSSFQGAENLEQEAAKRKQDNINKLNDSAYRQQRLDKLNEDENATVKHTGELGAQQISKSIKQDWKDVGDTWKAQQEAAKEKQYDNSIGGWRQSFKDDVAEGFQGAGTVLKAVGGTIVKPILGGVDAFVDDQKDIRKVKRDAEALGLKGNDYLEYITDEKNSDKYKQERINKLLVDDVQKDNTAKEIATERLINNATIVQNKHDEASQIIQEMNNIGKEISTEAEQLAEKTAQSTGKTKEEILQNIQDSLETGAVTGPVRDTDYLATVNALKSKKTTLDEKNVLFQQKIAELDTLQREHQLKEYELSPYTDNYYETERDAAKYKDKLGDKLYKKEDGSILSQGDQRDRDVYKTLKNLERVIFTSAEGIRDEYSNLYTGGVGAILNNSDTNWDALSEHDFLKNSDTFLDMSYTALNNIKEKLYDHYDELCDVVTNLSGEQEKVLNEDKLRAFLYANKSDLAKISDYIVDSKSGTKYSDVLLGRNEKYDDTPMNGVEKYLLNAWQKVGGLSSLFWSFTDSYSHENEKSYGIFQYDKPRDWINMATDNYGFWDGVWSLVASNPGQTAFIAGSSYFAVFGKAQYAVKGHGFLGSLGRMTTTANKYGKVNKWYKIGKIGSKYTSMAEGLGNITYSTRFLGLNKTVDYFARKGLGMLDEAFVSFPLDIGLNDGSAYDLQMNILFNGLGGLGKIQSMGDLEKLGRTMENFSNVEDMRKFVQKETGLADLAENLALKPGQKGYGEAMLSNAIDSHFKNIFKNDKNKAARYMSQVLNRNIDEIKWENLDEVEALTKAITENGNIGASLSKNRSKNINQIISEAKSKLEKTKNGTDILSIQNKAVSDVKSEFRGLLSNFDVDKLNKIYHRNFASDLIGQSFSNFIIKWSDATGVPKSDLMLIFMDSMNTRSAAKGDSVAELFKKRVIQGLSDGSIQPPKGAKSALREVNKIFEETKEPIGTVMDMTKMIDGHPEEVSNVLSELEEKWLHDMREAYKPVDVAAEEAEIQKGLEKEKKIIENEKNAAIEQAKRENKYASNSDTGTQGRGKAETTAELEEKGTKILNNAKQVAKDPELLKRIREAEEEYSKGGSSLGNELDEVIAKDKERRYNSFQDDADEAGMSLEEYHKAQNLKYDKLLEDRAVTNWLNETQGGITKDQYLKKISEAEGDGGKLPTNKRIEIIENYLAEKYGMDFSDEFMRKQIGRDLQKAELVEQGGYLTIRDAVREKFNAVWENGAWKTDTGKLTKKQQEALAKEIKDDAIATAKKDRDDMTKPLKDQLKSVNSELKAAEKAKNEAKIAELTSQAEDLQYKIGLFDERINLIQNYPINLSNGPIELLNNIDAAYKIAASQGNKLIGQRGLVSYKTVKDSAGNKVKVKGNPYKEFSNAVNTFIEDSANINKVTGGKKTSITDFEKIFKSLNGETSETRLDTFDKILEKINPELQKTTEKGIKNAEAAVKSATKQAEKTAAQKTAEAEQMAMQMTKDVKKQGLQNKINQSINDALDYLESPAGKKSGLLQSTQTITRNMDDISRQNFLGTLGAIVKDMEKMKANTALLGNLSKVVTDSWPKKVMNSITKEIKAGIKAGNGYDVSKLQSLVGPELFKTNQEKWANMLKGNQINEVVKEVTELKVTENMSQAMLGLADESKTADDVIKNIIESEGSIRNKNLASANRIIGENSKEAMYLYQRALLASTMQGGGKTVAEAAEETAFAAAKSKTSGASQKRVNKMKKQNKAEAEAYEKQKATASDMPVEEAKTENGLSNMDEDLAQSVKKNEERKASLSDTQKKAEEELSKDSTLTEKEKTLMRFGIVDEATRIMGAVSKGKSPGMIKAEFLDGEGYAFLRRLLDFGPDEIKEAQLFEKAFTESRKQIQGIGYQLFHGLKNILFNGSDSLKTSSGKFSLNDLLKAIPSRITSGMKGFRSGGVIYDPRVTLTKYIMESNLDEGTKFMKGELSNFFRSAFAKESRKNLGPNFLRAFGKEASNLDMPDVAAEEFMNLYNKFVGKLHGYGVEDRVIHDILNPMFYNPLEYVRGIGMGDIGNVLQGEPMENMVLAKILKSYQGLGNHLPESIQDFYSSIRNGAKTFESFAGGAVLKNRNALEFGESLGEYMGKVDSLPIGKEQFAEWMNKTLSHITELGDDTTRKITALDSAMTPLYNKAKNVLDKDKYDEFMQYVDNFLFSEEGGLKARSEMRDGYDEFMKAVNKYGLKGDDKEIQEVLDVVKRSIDEKETGEARVLTNYLYDRMAKRTEEYLKATGKTPDKFNPADIMNRKAIQEEVMNKYNNASADEIIKNIKASNSKNVQNFEGTKGKSSVVTNKYSKENKATLELYGWGQEETKLSEDILGGIDMNALLEKGELPEKEQLKEIFNRVVNNGESYEKLMMENGYFKEFITDSLDNLFDQIEKKSGKEFMTIGKDGEFVLKQEASKLNWLQRKGAMAATRGHVMSQDRESDEILANINKTKETAYISKNKIDFGKIMGDSNIKLLDKNISLESFLSMSQTATYEIASRIKKSNRGSIVEEAVNRIFKGIRNPEMDEKMAGEGKELLDFLYKYREQVDFTRRNLGLGENWNRVFNGMDFRAGVAENKLANRLSGIWNYLSKEDMSRLVNKYDADINGVWTNFEKNILYNARADMSDEAFKRFLEKANFATQKYAVFRNYNPTQVTKAGQQVVSNMSHARGILQSLSVAGTSEFDELFEMFQKSDVANLGFDIFESEGKYGERIFDKGNEKIFTTAGDPSKNILQKTKKNEKGLLGTNYKFKDGNKLKNFLLFGKDLVTSNALMRGDRATQKWAVKSSLALATENIYKQGGTAGVRRFTEDVKKYNELMNKYGLKERDLMTRDSFYKKAKNILNDEMAEARKAGKLKTEEDVVKYFDAIQKDQQEFLYNFYRNEYAPFMGKARTAMGTFFVADNIKEFGSIEFWDKNKYALGLMKWSTGKVGEYAFDIGTAFNKNFDGTLRGLRNTISDPTFKRLGAELFDGAHTMRQVEKMTNHEFTVKDGAKATLVPIAALSMLIGECVIDMCQKLFSSETWDAEGWDLVSNVWDASLGAAFDFVTDRFLIYAGIFAGDINESLGTASTIGFEDNSQEWLRAFVNTWAGKFYKNNPISKFTTLRSAGYSTDASQLINTSTILAEIGLNQASSKRDTWSEIGNNIYNLSKNVYDDNDKLITKILKHAPVIKKFYSSQTDMGVLLPMLDEKIEKLGLNGFLKETTSRKEITRLINNMEKNVMLNNDKYKDWVMKNGVVDGDDENAVKMAMIRAGVYKDSLQAFDIVKKGLNKEDIYGEGEAALWLEMMKPEDRQALFDEFSNLYQKYVIDKGKADDATTKLFDKFVLAASKYGGSMSMAGYMGAYDTAFKAMARKAYGLAYDEVGAGKQGDEWLAAEGDIDLNNIPESKYGNYIKYVDTVRDFELGLIVDNWDVLSREKSIGIELRNKYIETDKENFGWSNYISNIGDENSNLSKLFQTLTLNEVAEEQGLPGMIVPVAYQQKKASDNYLKALGKAKTPEEKAEIGEKFLKIQESLGAMADKFIDNPQAAGLVKASLASGIITFADDIRKESPEVLQKVIDIIGEKAINKVLNSLTDSPTVTMADAFEIATGVNAHDGSGGKGKGRGVSIPSAKARENYVNKMLIPNYNRAKAAAAGTGGGDGTSLPKFTTGYGRAKDGSIISVKIPVPQRKQLRDLPTNSIDTQTAKLDVAPLPVKEGRVIGGKYSARAIQNAKVYSRRIGK